MNASIKIILVFAVISTIAAGMVYNSIRINSSERQQQEAAALISDSKTTGHEAHGESCCTGEDESAGTYTDNSIYQAITNWTDQSGNTLNLGSFKGKKIVLSMIFANCIYACPVLVNDMKRVEKTLPEGELKNTEFVLVSIDPARDTPASLTEYAKRQQLDLSRWKLLTGKESEIRELAALFGFKYQKDNKGDFSHSNLINVLNRQGEIVYQHEGLNKDISDIVGQVKSIN